MSVHLHLVEVKMQICVYSSATSLDFNSMPTIILYSQVKKKNPHRNWNLGGELEGIIIYAE